VSSHWKALTGAWVVQVAALHSVGGVVGYLALHHEKMEQRPPDGWTGRRLRPSKGYFARSGRERRERARAWLWEYRQRKLSDLDDGGLLELASRPGPRVYRGRAEWEKQATEVVREPGARAGSTLASIRENDRRLLVAAELRVGEDEVERFVRLWHESMREEAIRKRRRREAS
jgi:hypothetical protein